jgi:uncharacterized membrane protein
MEMLHKLEEVVASWYKGLPHLPENFRKWLADNIWWLVLVGVILSLLVVIPAFGVLLFGGAVLTATYGASGSAYYGGWFVWALIGLMLVVADLVLSALAIAPLKAHRKMGWSLLFLVALLNVLSTVMTFIANYSFGGLISGLIGAAIGGYFLFEIRGHFGAVAKTPVVPAQPAAPTEAKKS